MPNSQNAQVKPHPPLTLEVWQERINQNQTMRRNDHRDGYGRDRARILHSAAFRRLQAKTQVHSTGENDFFRTRLTHSLEAAQLGSGILAQIRKKQPEFSSILATDCLIEALCLAHDIGHPPFGHGGEIALNFMLRDFGGFEGNAQTFRILTHLEPYTKTDGMNLTRRTLLGVLKYPTLMSNAAIAPPPCAIKTARRLQAKDWHPAKAVYDIDQSAFDWVLAPFSDSDKAQLTSVVLSSGSQKHHKTQFKSLDCSIMELADDIAYGVHDLEDAIVLGLVHEKDWQQHAKSAIAQCGDTWVQTHLESISQKLFSDCHYQRKDAIGAIVNALLTSIQIEPTTKQGRFESPLLAFNAKLTPQMQLVLNVLKSFVWQFVIQLPEVQMHEYRGQQILMDIFEALAADPMRLLPVATKNKWQQAEQEDQTGMRVIADYLSAMTDGYALKTHQLLFGNHR